MSAPGTFLASLLPGQRRSDAEQNASAIVTNINSGQEGAVRSELETVGSSVESTKGAPFSSIPTVHYAAWLILPGVKEKSGGQGPARLLLETNYDGTLENHLDELVKHCRSELDRLYQYCEGYPAPSARTPDTVRAHLSARQVKIRFNTCAYYVALPGRTVRDIKNAIGVYEEAKHLLEALPEGISAEQARGKLLAHFKGAPTVKPVRSPITQKGLQWRFILSLPIGIPVAIFWVPLCLISRLFEKKEARDELKQPLFDPTGHEPEYTHLDLGTQNHLCTFATLKPGRFRRFVATSALFLGRLLFRHIFILGKLDEMTTVHFARWTLIDDQLLFYGNYDGDYSSYLGDFSDQAWGVNLIWCNTIGFPATQFLYRGGAKDLIGFARQALTHYSPAPVFYSAYGDYSLPNLLRYLNFRDDLAEEIGA